jgi:hypothetical protein
MNARSAGSSPGTGMAEARHQVVPSGKGLWLAAAEGLRRDGASGVARRD